MLDLAKFRDDLILVVIQLCIWIQDSFKDSLPLPILCHIVLAPGNAKEKIDIALAKVCAL